MCKEKYCSHKQSQHITKTQMKQIKEYAMNYSIPRLMKELNHNGVYSSRFQ